MGSVMAILYLYVILLHFNLAPFPLLCLALCPSTLSDSLLPRPEVVLLLPGHSISFTSLSPSRSFPLLLWFLFSFHTSLYLSVSVSLSLSVCLSPKIFKSIFLIWEKICYMSFDSGLFLLNVMEVILFKVRAFIICYLSNFLAPSLILPIANASQLYIVVFLKHTQFSLLCLWSALYLNC